MTREVLIRDLSKCIDCDVCVTACAERHGRPRQTMEGPRFGHFQLPDVCRNCPDTPCVTACRLNGMFFDDGKTFVADTCRGCNKCVEACPFGVVTLLERNPAREMGFFERILGAANRRPAYTPARILTDATRCIQCGICGYSCPVDIPVREWAREGRTMDDPRCLSCGLCIQNCPRGTLKFETHPALPIPMMRADKCDLCRSYGDSACVTECPTKAMLRLPVDENLRLLNEDLYVELTARDTADSTQPIELRGVPQRA
jgi:Fe-S-cluster-containing hydrogenase component 2